MLDKWGSVLPSGAMGMRDLPTRRQPKLAVNHLSSGRGTAMPAVDAMGCDKLAKLIGTPRCPILLDIRRAALREAQPAMIPTARALPEAALSPDGAAALARDLRAKAPGQSVVVACAEGHGRSQGLAAWLRHEGLAAEYLEGGFAAWARAGHLTVAPPSLPLRCDPASRSLWVTRARPKIDRIACPWLIRRFVDPAAVILFVAPGEVASVAEAMGAQPFDIEDVFWSHRGATCTFDTMLAEFGLHSPALNRLAAIIRAADTGKPDQAPEAAGLLAISLGLSRQYADDQAQLGAGMAVYDALYRWARDASEETHGWPKAGKVAK